MDLMEKLRILSDAAKYDVACTSSGIDRGGKKGQLGNAAAAGICHSFSADGRCVTLLKVLQTNVCIYDCQYCVNRRSNDVPRAAFLPEELAQLTVDFYRRNYIEGLFLSSAVIKNPDYTMEMLCRTLSLVRDKYRFNGYIHVKAIPGADPELIRGAGLLADRMSVNIELPSEDSLKLLAPEKNKQDILAPMNAVKNGIIRSKAEMTLYKHAPSFVPAGQSTQLIVGATPESDHRIVTLAQGLYDKYSLKRVFYSAYTPVTREHPILPFTRAPLLREHRLYQADWLLRFYKFRAEELLREDQNLDLNMDPKCSWAINNLDQFPVEVNTAEYETLLRVPGIGVKSAQKIISSRRVGRLDFDNLRKMNIVLKRAKYFITCGGRMYHPIAMKPETLTLALSENKINEAYEQLTLESLFLRRREEVKCLTGEI
ncbi:MAG: putative DNA modification/repair radical SAM protein [Defluviitaleaceae bacterium]|nr:putative DNA modification/repair radical SAM protein [Defluviitaleaceae bacterium]